MRKPPKLKPIPKVKKSVLLKYFDGSVKKTAGYFDIDKKAVYGWGEYIPDVRAYQIRDAIPKLVVKQRARKKRATR